MNNQKLKLEEYTEDEIKEILNNSEPSMTPMITTFGYFLNKCEQNVRRDIIDRLVQLQTEEIEVKPYKVIDVDLIDEIKGSLENNDEMER